MPRRSDAESEASSEKNATSAACEGATSSEAKRVALTDREFSFEAAVAFLAGRTNVELMRPSHVDQKAVFRLDRMRALVQALGNPQTSFRAVHVAGSKGKGSVCEMTAAALAGCRFTVGVFTSPHLVDVRERIRVGGETITPGAFARAVGRVAAAAEGLPAKFGEVTAFEALTAAAFVHFAQEAVDVAVIEVGMGGEHDATNVLVPVVCVLTAIQNEHAQLLGKTKREIARAKAGIMKPGVPAITLPQTEEVLTVFREHAAAVGTTVKTIGTEIEFSSRFESSTDEGPQNRVCLTGKHGSFEHLTVPLPGEHQSLNCGLALAVLDVLRGLGLPISDAQVAAGLRGTARNGRLELIHDQPRIFVDGAHNPESIQGLVKAAGAHIRYDSMVVVFGCAADKDYEGMLERLADGADKIFFTRSEGSERSVDPRDLHRKFAEISSRMSQVVPNLKDAINAASRAVSKGDIVLVTGSFLIAGEAKRLFAQRAARTAQAEVASRTEVKPRSA